MVNFDIGDIVRVIHTPNFPISISKHIFANKVGFIVKFDERYNDFNHVYVKFFDYSETILINKHNLMKESEFILKQDLFEQGFLKYEKVS